MKKSVSNKYLSICTDFRSSFCKMPLKLDSFGKQPGSNEYNSIYSELGEHVVKYPPKMDGSMTDCFN